MRMLLSLDLHDVIMSAGKWPASPRARTDTLPLALMTMCVIEACGKENLSHASGGLRSTKKARQRTVRFSKA